MRRLGALLSLPVLLLGCTGEARRTPQSPETQAAAPPAPPSDENFGESVSLDEELSLIEGIRGLKAKRPVIGRALDGNELESLLLRAYNEQVPPHVSKGNEAFLELLGVVPTDFRYQETLIGLLRLGIAGLYEPRDQKLYLRKELSAKTKRSTLLHELVHTLEDQHFDLSQFTRFREDATDHQSAYSCLAEGDAMSVMTDAVLVNSGKTALDLTTEGLFQLHADGSEMQDAKSQEFLEKNPPPPILLRSLLAPYVDGVNFVHTLRQKGGFSAVNDAFRSPPRSTEQVLHPEKYFAKEQPREVALPSAPDGFSLLFHDVFGEQTLRIVLEEWESPGAARQAAAGWGGDRVAIFARGQSLALAWSFKMDSEADARELEEAWNHRLGPTTDESVKTPKIPGRNCVERPFLGPLAYERRGTRLLVVAGPYDPEAPVAVSEQTPRAAAKCADLAGWFSTLASE